MAGLCVAETRNGSEPLQPGTYDVFPLEPFYQVVVAPSGAKRLVWRGRVATSDIILEVSIPLRYEVYDDDEELQ